MTAARSTDEEAPVRIVYPTSARTIASARRRRGQERRKAAIVAATIAMFQPEIATTWLTPAVVKAAARSRSTRSRNPIRIPAASPACGSGKAWVRASSPARRTASIVEAGPPASPRIDRSVACSVPSTPVPAR